MFSTSLVAAVVTGLAASGSVAGLPAWQTDYRTAMTQSSQQHKPVAVFIARGGDGYAKLVTGGIGADAAKLLKQNYVCMYVDTATEAGQKLSGAFGLAEGLVISDKSGGIQALRHTGSVSQATLAQYLTKFSEVSTVATTEAYSGMTAPVAAPMYAPAVNPYQAYIYGGGYGSCPGGNCGGGVVRGGCPGGRCR